MKMWSRGRLLLTRDTKKWPKEKQDAADANEKLCVYTNFSSTDQGRARQQVCWVNPDHPDYEENMRLIVMAPQIKSDSDYFLKQLNELRMMSWRQKLKWIFRNE